MLYYAEISYTMLYYTIPNSVPLLTEPRRITFMRKSVFHISSSQDAWKASWIDELWNTLLRITFMRKMCSTLYLTKTPGRRLG